MCVAMSSSPRERPPWTVHLTVPQRARKGRGVRQKLPFSLQVAPLSHGAARAWEDCPDLRTWERTQVSPGGCARRSGSGRRERRDFARRGRLNGVAGGVGRQTAGEGSPSAPTPAPRPCTRPRGLRASIPRAWARAKQISPRGTGRGWSPIPRGPDTQPATRLPVPPRANSPGALARRGRSSIGGARSSRAPAPAPLSPEPPAAAAVKPRAARAGTCALVAAPGRVGPGRGGGGSRGG